MELQVFIHRYFLTNQPYIEVKKEDRSAHNIWMLTMDRDIRVFSPIELEMILKECRAILGSMRQWEIPLDFNDLVDALEYVLCDLGIQPSFMSEEQERIFRKMGVPDIDKLFLKRD